MNSFEIFLKKQVSGNLIVDFISKIYRINVAEIYTDFGDYSGSNFPDCIKIYCVITDARGDFCQRIELFERFSQSSMEASDFASKFSFMANVEIAIPSDEINPYSFLLFNVDGRAEMFYMEAGSMDEGIFRVSKNL